MEITSSRKPLSTPPKKSLGESIKKRLVQAIALPSFIEIPNVFPQMRTVDAEVIEAFAEPGDIILSSDKSLPLFSALSQVGLGSDFGHAALYAGEGKVIESGPKGVVEKQLFHSGTHFTLIKPEYQSEEDSEKAVDYAQSMVGQPYDWSSSNDGYSVNCTDLVANALNQGDTDFDIKESNILGTRAVTTQAFLENEKLKVAVDGDQPLWKEVVGALPFIGLTVAGGVAGHAIHGTVGAIIGATGTYVGANLAWNVAEQLISPSLDTRPWAQAETAPDPEPQPELSLEAEAAADPSKPLLLQPEWRVPTETTTQALDRLGIRI